MNAFAQNDLSNYSSRERGILSTASKWKMTAGRQTLSQNYTNTWIIQEIKDGHIAEERVWELVLNDPCPQWVKCDSGALGILTTIGDYENKKGVVSKAHFTTNNKYLGSVAKLGDKPISYEGNFRFNDYKDNFEFYLNQEADMNVLDFFRVKKEEEAQPVPVAEAPKEVPKRKRPTIVKPKKPIVGDE